MFQFESVNDFIHMGGHGYYVWSAYFISLSALTWLVMSPLIRRRKFIQEMGHQRRRELARQ